MLLIFFYFYGQQKTTTMILKKKLNILFLEDKQADIEIATRELKSFIRDFKTLITHKENDFIDALKEFKPDIIISDYIIPGFDGLSAFKIKNKLAPEIPFVILTGSLDEETAVKCLKEGVDDYLIKEHIKRLGPSVITTITKKKNEINHKKALEELKVSEEINRSITDSAAESIMLLDADGKVITWNKSSEKMFGYTSTEMLGSSVLKIIPLNLASNHNQHFSRFKNGEILSVIGKTLEVRAITKDKKEIPVELSLSKWSKGENLYITAVLREISERKNAEKVQTISYNIAYKANTTNNLTDLFKFIRNELGKIIDTTNFYIAIYNKQDNTLNLPFITDTIENPKHLPAGKSLTKYVIDTKKSLLADEDSIDKLIQRGIVEQIGPKSKVWLGVPLIVDGEAIGVIAVQSYSSKNNFTNDQQKILEFVSNQISLTINRKKKEEDLKIALEKAQEADKLKSAFLQNISHEIRTPMNGILGFTSLLSDPDLSKQEVQSYIDIINISGKRMLNTLNDLMEISRLDAGQISVNKNIIDINTELKELYNFFKEEAVKKELKFEIYTDLPNDACFIETDKSKFLAILRNLLKNAFKYTRSGQVKFGYTSEKNEIKFYVKDTGIGIHPEKQKSIFERFVQADLEDIKVHEGTGLGLSISKAYIELMGGNIWLNSNINEGSKFYFTIPHQNSISKETKNEEEKSGKKKLIALIAEDEEVTDHLLTIILGDYCDVIFHAKNGEEAVDIAKNNPNLDLILMDMKMPKMNGYRATELIREFNKDIKIIAQTAYALSGDREKSIKAGCDDYITKPINNELLITKILALTGD